MFSLHHKLFDLLIEVTHKVDISSGPRRSDDCKMGNWDEWGRCSIEIFYGNEKKDEKVPGINFANLTNSPTPNWSSKCE